VLGPLERGRHNPYAPPGTSEPAPGAGADRPGGPEPGVIHRPARTLWPLFPLAFCAKAVLSLRIQASHRPLLLRAERLARSELLAEAALAGNLLALPLAGLLGDRRAARPLLLLGLLLMAAATLATLAPWSSPAFVLPVEAVCWLGSSIAAVIVTANVLRGVTVRGVYVAVLLLYLTRTLAATSARHGTTLLDGGTATLIVAAGCALLAALFVRWVHPAAQTAVPEGVEDPLRRPPLATGATVILILLLGLHGVLVSLVEDLHQTLSPVVRGGSSWVLQNRDIVPALLGLLLPLLAFRRRWRPRPLMAAGMVATALGGLAAVASTRWGWPLILISRAALVLGRQDLCFPGSAALLRQNLPVARIALWWAALSLVSALARMLVFYTLAQLEPERVVTVATALILALVLGLLRVTRGR